MPSAYSLLNVVRSRHEQDASIFNPYAGQREISLSAKIAKTASENGAELRGGTFLPVGPATRTLTSSDFLADSIRVLTKALRPTLLLNQLGSQTVELTGNRSGLAVGVPAIAAGGYAAEDMEAVETTVTFSGVSLSGADAYTKMVLSRQLLKTPGAETTMLDLMRRTLAATVEQGVLAGNGANGQPLGLLTAPELPQQQISGQVPTLAEAAAIVETVLLADGAMSSMAWLMSAADFSPAMQAVHGDTPTIHTGNAKPFSLVGLPVMFSRFIPAGRFICADWSQLTIGFWGAPELIVDPYSLAASGKTRLTIWQTVASGVANRGTFVIGKAA